jgi:hypothetical protein
MLPARSSSPARRGDHRLSRGWSTDLAPTEDDTGLQTAQPESDPDLTETPRPAGDAYVQNVDPEAMPLEKLNAFLYDLPDQPAWRQRADVECDYYDSNQYTAQDLADMKAKGLPPIVVNMVGPAIDMVLGLEAKTRRDWIVKPEDEAYADEAAAMTVKMKEFERLSGADRACSDAYASQIKSGLGWVEVGIRKADPLGYRFRCTAIHRRELWWDWLDEDPGLEYARYLVRRKWYDVDLAASFFPQYAGLFDHAISHWAHFDPAAFDQGVPMYMDQSVERQFAFSDEEWRNSLRRRVCLYEVWYRTYKNTFVLRGQNGQAYEFQPNNPTHQAAIIAGIADVEAVVLPKMRLSWWLGPHRLVDMPSPYPHQHFPYVPFWGFREDRTGVPYGMIRRMKPLQDEVNARRAKMLWQLSARRVIVDDDAVLDHGKVMREVARPDAYIKLNAARKNKGNLGEVISVEDHQGLTTQQFNVYQDSKQTLQDSAGIYQQQLGKKDVADSGIAISQLIEQGTTTLAEINDNFSFARTRVGEIGLALVKADMAGKKISVTVERRSVKKRVKFNVPKTDEDGRGYLENDVTRMNMRMALDEVPQTPTARSQQFMLISEMVKTLPENLQAAVIDLVVKASDLPQKEEMISRLRSTLGIQETDPELMTPEEQDAFAKQMQSNAQIEAMQKKLLELEAKVQEATAEEKRAGATLKKAQTAKTLVEANLDPGSIRGTSEDWIEDSPERAIIEQAAADAETDVPGSDPVALERGRRGGVPSSQSGKPAAPPGVPSRRQVPQEARNVASEPADS